MYAIETGIPLPNKKGTDRPYRIKYPFAKLKPGESFFVPGMKRASIYSCLEYWHKKCEGTKFVFERSAEGVRFWRVE